MPVSRSFHLRIAPQAAVVAALAGLYCLARPPELGESARRQLAEGFAFRRAPIEEPATGVGRSIREVHPSLNHVSSWISAFGAAIAVSDIDGDGLPNDLCHVEVRADQVIVSTAPGTPRRYEPFILDPAPLPYDSRINVPTGCMSGDFNEDGLTDLLVYYWGRTPILFVRLPGGEKAAPTAAAYRRQELLAPGERWYTNAATSADIDGDGHVDLLFGNYFPDGARILDARADGTEQMPDSLSRAANGGKNRIFLWKGAAPGDAPAATFEEATGALEGRAAFGWTLALGAADIDGDLRPELYVANDFGPDVLLHNRSEPGRVVLVPLKGLTGLNAPHSKVLGQDSFKSMSVDFADLNDDGVLDLYVSNITSRFAFRESNFAFISTGDPRQMKDGIAPFVDKSDDLGLAEGGWGWDTRFGDFNNDGSIEALLATGFVRGEISRWPELQELGLANETLVHLPMTWFNLQPGDDLSGREHNPFYVRAADGRFYDLARELGVNEPQVTRGLATADVDGDGDLDILVANQWESSKAYLNETPKENAFLGLDLRLPLRGGASPTASRPGRGPDAGGRAAIGARAAVRLPGGRRLIGYVDGGNGHSGDRSPDIHFGLGRVAPSQALDVELAWRDRCGAPHEERLSLPPGWHTVTLASSECADAGAPKPAAPAGSRATEGGNP